MQDQITPSLLNGILKVLIDMHTASMTKEERIEYLKGLKDHMNHLSQQFKDLENGIVK